jgi:hypothetical protein
VKKNIALKLIETLVARIAPGTVFAIALLLAGPLGAAEKTVVSPSPDKRNAFLETFSTEARTLDLIERKSGKILLRAAESEEGGNRLDTDALWAANSCKVAVMVSTQRRSAAVVVFSRDSSGTFHRLEMPVLPEAKIPARYEGDARIHHVAAIDWSRPVRWQKDGMLVVETETMVDGNENSVTATRTTVVAFDKAGTGRVVSSKLKVAAHFVDPPVAK